MKIEYYAKWPYHKVKQYTQISALYHDIYNVLNEVLMTTNNTNVCLPFLITDHLFYITNQKLEHTTC